MHSRPRRVFATQPRIRQIRQATGVFLTLHGGSGTEDADFLAGIQAGLTVIHINTELRVAWRQGLENSLKTHPRDVTPYKILPAAERAMEDIVTRRLALFNSNGDTRKQHNQRPLRSQPPALESKVLFALQSDTLWYVRVRFSFKAESARTPDSLKSVVLIRG
jgi:hypothetical protein